MNKKYLIAGCLIIFSFCLFLAPAFAKSRKVYLARHHHYNKNRGKFTKLSANFSSPSFSIASNKREFSKSSFSIAPAKKGEFSKPSFSISAVYHHSK